MRLPSFVALAFAAAVSGCATTYVDCAPERADKPWHPPAATAVRAASAANADAAPPKTAGSDTLRASGALAAVLPPLTVDPAHPYGLAELIDIAESNHPSTRVAWNDARNAALALGLVQSTYLPTLTATAMQAHQEGYGHRSGIVQTSTDTRLNGTLGVLSMQWLLFDFGGRRALSDAAEQASLIANTQFTAVHQQIIFDTSVAYYAYQAARARVVTAVQASANAEAVETAAKARFQHGEGTVVEVAQATQNRAQAKLALVQARNTESNGYLDLVAAMGISPLTEMKIAAMPVRPFAPNVRGSIDEVVADAIARRPDVLSAYAAEKANQAKIAAAESDFRPKVFLSASASYSRGSSNISAVPSIGDLSPTVNLDGTGTHRNTGIFVGISMPLFDGGRREARLAQARNDADSAAEKLVRTKQQAVRQVVTAQNGLVSSLAAHDAARALKDAAQTTYDAAFAAYKHGVGTITDALLAQNQLLAAQNAYSDSYSATLAAAATLALATGAIDSTELP
jgi:outer membrane protein TolC